MDKKLHSLGLEPSKILPHEIWLIILKFVYFDSDIIHESQKIHEALAYVRATLPLISKRLRFTCNAFNLLNGGVSLSKDKLRLFYQDILKSRFLEYRDGGLYLINGERGLHEKTNSKITQFIATRTEIANNIILIRLIEAVCSASKTKGLRNNVL